MAEIYGSDASNLTPGQQRSSWTWLALAIIVVLAVAIALTIWRG